MTRASIYFTDTQLDFMEKQENASEVVRRALDEYIAKVEAKPVVSASRKGEINGR